MAEDYRALRIIAGHPAAVEDEVNALLSEYTPVVWNFNWHDGVAYVMTLLIHEREITKSRLAATRMQMGPMVGMKPS